MTNSKRAKDKSQKHLTQAVSDNQQQDASVAQLRNSSQRDRVELNSLSPHPINLSIYGQDPDVSDLLSLTASQAIVSSLIITPHRLVLADHRQFIACLQLGLSSVPVEVKQFNSETLELKFLLAANSSPDRNNEQKIRLGLLWEKVEKDKARQRQTQLAGTRPNTQPDLSVNLRQGLVQGEKGRTDSIVGKRVGLSGSSYTRGVKVVQEIDAATAQGNTQLATNWRQVLNEQSVDAAYQLLKQPEEERLAIALHLVSGKARSVKQAAVLIERASSDRIAQLPSVATTRKVCPYNVGDVVKVNMGRGSVAPEEKQWNGFWGLVVAVSESGIVSVDVGVKENLRLLSHDLVTIDGAIDELRNVVTRVLQLRKLATELDEIEIVILNTLQKKDWFTSRQLAHLSLIEQSLNSELTLIKL